MGAHASDHNDENIRQLKLECPPEATKFWSLAKYFRYVHWPTLMIRVLNKQTASLKIGPDNPLE